MSRGQWTQGSGGGLDTSELTATADKVLKGYIAGVKDSDEPQEGTLEVQSIVNFNVALYGSLALIGTWQNPEVGPYSGVMIRYKVGGYPGTIDDGELAYEGAESSFIVSGLIDGTEYYFRAWPYMTTNYGRVYADTYCEAIGTAQEIKGNQTFTSSGAFIVPENIRSVDIFLVGGGGGATGEITKNVASGGGGGGYTKTHRNVTVVPGQTISVTVGAGGNYGVAGGSSYFGGYGIGGGQPNHGTLHSNGGNGGSGGGGGGYNRLDGGGGGSDGNNGWTNCGMPEYSRPGQGQHYTTRAFDNGTLYAGGGGGSGTSQSGSGPNGSGNDGFGRPNTGGGAGSGMGKGGSGIVLIRWGY